MPLPLTSTPFGPSTRSTNTNSGRHVLDRFTTRQTSLFEPTATTTLPNRRSSNRVHNSDLIGPNRHQPLMRTMDRESMGRTNGALNYHGGLTNSHNLGSSSHNLGSGHLVGHSPITGFGQTRSNERLKSPGLNARPTSALMTGSAYLSRDRLLSPGPSSFYSSRRTSPFSPEHTLSRSPRSDVEEMQPTTRQHKLKMIELVSRATSPAREADSLRATRMSRSSEVFSLPHLTTLHPNQDMSTQVSEDILTQETMVGARSREMPKADFDFFESLRLSLHKRCLRQQEDTKTTTTTITSLATTTTSAVPTLSKTEGSSKSSGYVQPAFGSQKAAMTSLLPGNQPLPPRPQHPQTLQNGDDVEESESEYESEYESEEEATTTEIDETSTTNNDLTTQNNDDEADLVDLDYLDDDDDEGDEGLKKRGEGRRRTFCITGTVDIDIWLAEEESKEDELSNVENNTDFDNLHEQVDDHREASDEDGSVSLKDVDEDRPSLSPCPSSSCSSSTVESSDEDRDRCFVLTESTSRGRRRPKPFSGIGRSECSSAFQWLCRGASNYVPKVHNCGTRRRVEKRQKVGSNDGVELPETRALNTATSLGPHSRQQTVDMQNNDDNEDDDQQIVEDLKYNQWLEEASKLHRSVMEDEEETSTLIDQEISTSITSDMAKNLISQLVMAEGLVLKRHLFALKHKFQSNPTLVFDFVSNNGLTALINLPQMNDDPQMPNLVLRALGQLMLFVDGMNGVMECSKCQHFLYNLLASEKCLVRKTAVKLLIVFVEYHDHNALRLADAINEADQRRRQTPWANVINVLNNHNDDDHELTALTLSLVNKTLFGLEEQQEFFKQTDLLELQNMDQICSRLSSSTSEESVQQALELYNVALKQEDGESVTESDIAHLDEDSMECNLRSTLRTVSDPRSRQHSLRFTLKTLKEADNNNNDNDDQDDLKDVSFLDLQRFLELNNVPIDDQLATHIHEDALIERARLALLAKRAKGEDKEFKEQKSNTEAKVELKDTRSIGEVKWSEIETNFNRKLVIGDLDFSDLMDSKDTESIESINKEGCNGAVPPPPPPPLPPPMIHENGMPPPPTPPMPPLPPPLLAPPSTNPTSMSMSSVSKSRKTIKLFWKEVPPSPMSNSLIWDELADVDIDYSLLEYLFENRAKDLNANKESKSAMQTLRQIVVLDHKRSNAINIGMTKLPPPRVIKSAVLKMDSSIMNREAVEKLLTMLPSSEEIRRINEAMESQPDVPLGSAEQFLFTLSTINGLEARLRLWSFKMEFEAIESELCEPLMDLKIGLEKLRENFTFRAILAVLLAMGNFLNGSPSCKGFQIDYLSKVPEVKDTLHKHSLLYHLTYWVQERFPSTSDLYSELGPLTRASRVDFDDLNRTLTRIESECKLAWQHLESIESPQSDEIVLKMDVFLMECGERVMIMRRIFDAVMRKHDEFLVFLGLFNTQDRRAQDTCRTVSEFALEFRTTRERVLQTMAKKRLAKERRRNAKRLQQQQQGVVNDFNKVRLEAVDQGEQEAVVQNENVVHRRHHSGHHRGHHRSHRRVSQEQMDDQLKKLLTDVDVAEANNTLVRRRKKNRKSAAEDNEDNDNDNDDKMDRRRHHRRGHRGHRGIDSSNLALFTSTTSATSEVEKGLLESLLGAGNESHRRNKRHSRKQEAYKGSRTRDLNAL